MSSVQLGYYQIKCGEADVIMAGGTDSMSNAQYTVDKLRYGATIGHTELRDSMWDSLTNLGIGPPMGMTAENVAAKYSISREEQDKLALISQQRAINAIDKGLFKEEIIPVEIKSKKKSDPEIMGIGPVSASKKALEKAALSLSDIELIELNEAFAAQYLACEKAMGLNREITNVNGSGVSLGHPVGASGARLIVTLMYEMKRRNLTKGLATLCAGGGMGTAVVIQRT
jgi:acetyl-CoA acetyltransferase